jgi:hypothetical protein
VFEKLLFYTVESSGHCSQLLFLVFFEFRDTGGWGGQYRQLIVLGVEGAVDDSVWYLISTWFWDW